MASMVVFFLFMAVIFVGLSLALAFGYQAGEQRRAAESREHDAEVMRAAEALAALPGFFVREEPARQAPEPPGVKDAFVVQVEGYLRAEQAVVAQFVNDPSIANLYRQPRIPPGGLN